MSSPEEPYSPSAELVRTHIRNAVNHLLLHPPVQGKAALERLVREVDSEYFPTETVAAIDFFKTGPLGRAREALIRNFVIILLKNLLRVATKTKPRLRRFAALNAVLAMHRQQGERTMAEKLPELVGTLPDDRWYRAIFLLANVEIGWGVIGDAGQVKAQNYVNNAPEDDVFRFLPYAMRVPSLRASALKRLPNASIETLERLVPNENCREVIDQAITRLEKAGRFRVSEQILQSLILPLAPSLIEQDVGRICRAFVENNQTTYAARTPRLMLQLFEETPTLRTPTEQSWKIVFDKLTEEEESIPEGKALKRKLKKEYDF